MTTIYDVTIIGGGPAGLYAAFYAGLRDLKTKVIEVQPELGGKLHVYPEKTIWDVGGQPPIKGQALIDQLVNQAKLFDPTIVLSDKVTAIKHKDDQTFLIEAASGEVTQTKTVIIAVGGGILKPKPLEVEQTLDRPATNIHYKIPSLDPFKGKNILIAGGGHSAVDWANMLEPIAKDMHICYRKKELAGHEKDVLKLESGRIKRYPETKISALKFDPFNDCVSGVTLEALDTHRKELIEIDHIIVNHGFEREADLLEASELNLSRVDDFYIKGTPDGLTDVEGIFAAGDIISYQGKVNLIAGCFQDAVNAVNQVKRYIEPSADERGMVSSHHEGLKDKLKR